MKRKLSKEQAIQIYLRAWAGVEKQREIAEEFQIAQHTVFDIMHRKSWRDATKDLKTPEILRSLLKVQEIATQKIKEAHQCE